MSSPISAHRVVWTSFFVDLLDIVLNATVSIATGSIVIFAELLQAIADLLSSAFLLVGLNRHKREIYFWTLMSALVMLLIAASLSFYFGLQRFLRPKEITNIYVAYGVLVVAALSNAYGFYISAKRLLDGKSVFKLVKIFNESKLIMTKNTFVLDLMGTSSAVVGLTALIFYQIFGDLRFDGVGAMCIGVVLAFLSINLIIDLKDLAKTKSVDIEV